MKRTLLLIFVAAASWAQAQTPTFVLGTKAGGIYSDLSNSIVIDQNENAYAAGTFEYSAVIGGVPLSSTGGEDIFVTKYDSAGNPQWALHQGGIYSDEANSIAIDNNANVYITGKITGTVIMGPDTFNAHSGGSCFIAKYNTNGIIQWAKMIKGGAEGMDIGIDPSGNIYVTGQFNDSIFVGSDTLVSTWDPNLSYYSTDIFIAKFDASGNALWGRQGGGTRPDMGKALDFDPAGNVYVTGRFQDNINFMGMPVTGTGTYSNTLYIARLTPSGNLSRIFTCGSLVVDGQAPYYSSNYTQGYEDIQVDNAGNAYVRRQSGGFNGYVLKYDSTGNMAWQAPVTISTYSGHGLFRDSNNDIYITGFDNITMKVVKISSTGGVMWTKNAVTQQGGFSEGRSIAVGTSGYVYLTGSYIDSLYLDNDSLSSNGCAMIGNTFHCGDIFIAKMQQSSITTPVSELSRITVNIHPNPFADAAILETNEMNSLLIITDVTGREVYRKVITSPSTMISREGMKSGIYYFSIVKNGQMLGAGKIAVTE